MSLARACRWLEVFFQIPERGTTISTELRGGLTTFLTMSYIMLVNPQVLGAIGLPPNDVGTSTAVLCGVGTMTLGLIGNVPFAIGPGMGLNTFFAGLGVQMPKEQILVAALLSGVLCTALGLFNVAGQLMRVFPLPIKTAIMVGIGLYQAFIGVRQIHLVIPSTNPADLVQLGNVLDPAILLALFGLLLTTYLFQKNVKGSILIGIGLVTLASWTGWFGVRTTIPGEIVRLPQVEESFWDFDFPGFLVNWRVALPNAIAFLFIAIFDVGGVIYGVGNLMKAPSPAAASSSTHVQAVEAEPVRTDFDLSESDSSQSEEVVLPEVMQATFVSVGLFTVLAAVFGCSPIIVFLECSAGVKEGARTGLASVVTGLLFLVAMFFIPVFSAVPVTATAPILILIGSLMMSGAGSIEWYQLDIALPCFLTICMMPFTADIASGIVFGLLFYMLLRVDSLAWSVAEWVRYNFLDRGSPPTPSLLEKIGQSMPPLRRVHSLEFSPLLQTANARNAPRVLHDHTSRESLRLDQCPHLQPSRDV
eukprot:NODE_596_length_2068_cov_26.752848_g550_i0.p1 GENE.NODE_596_length_2068_cov_26.752848_g550_i0~~NODE_596_length_2068_cov_26.752848_g550_i0.p1  ORF type:complete len:533 (-),score=88.85 NODE_596_length_2068_cov_26.752848_g550_i0:282-1880(-)